MSNQILFKKKENGSALVFILLAVALFGALSYTVASMMRDGNPEAISDSKAELYANEIMGYARSLRQSVQNIRISNGCSDTDVSFENTSISGYTHTPAASEGCQIFHPNGGSMTYVSPPADWLHTAEQSRNLHGDLYFPASACVDEIGTGDTNCHSDSNSDSKDLVIIFPWLKESICSKINKALGHGESIPINTSACWNYGTDEKFTGSYPAASYRLGLSGGGKMAQCVQCTASPTSGYHFYQVLIAR